jgi:hypothetical protein
MKPKRRAKSIHPWALWYWTAATENLFDLSPADLLTFKALVREATL